MIVTCEQCHARYLVATLKLGDTGRTVRCGVCSHTWFQPPVITEPAAASASFSDYMDPIPEGVRPLPEGTSIPVTQTKARSKFSLSKETIGSIVTASLLFFLILAGLIALHKPIAKAWLPSARFYALLGIDSSLPGEGLVIDHIAAKGEQGPEGQYRLTITGNISNTLSAETEIPPLEISIGAAHQILKLNKSTLKGQSVFPFTATYKDVAEDIKDVTVGFSTD